MSKFLKHFSLSTVLLISVQVNVIGQGTNNPISKISIASPTAASLGKYGDIPVNYHTGIPQVSIPIHTVTAGPISLPISLSYHAGGLKVQEPASWVGAGWSLNAGGVITRSVMGAPDEKGTNNGMVLNHGHFSDYGYHNYIRSGSSSQYNGVFWQDWAGILAGREDGEPDIFFFNFGGASGKFYFRDDRTPVIVPEADFKIEPNYPGNTNSSIQSFTITTSDGTKYYFGNTPGLSGTAPVEITKPVTDGNGMSTANVISSWYLNRILSADGQFSITLNYQTENYGYHTISMFPINGDPGTTTNMGFGSTHGFDLIKNVIQGVRLSEIVSPNGKVNFVAATNARTDLSDNFGSLNIDNVNTTAKALGSIEIAEGNNTVLKKFNLTYNYFEDNNTPIPQDIANFAPNLTTDRKRLKLEQVREVSADETQTKPPYVFTYFNEQVPRRLSFGIDHWGYVNGANNNQTLIPTYIRYATSGTYNHPGGDRDTYWPAMRAGSLQQINYPTGGYSLFEFEPNTVYSSSSSNVNVTVLNQSVRLYSQSEFISVRTFTTTANASNNVVNIAFENTSLYSATYSITDINNNVVYSMFIGNGQVSPVNSVTLPPGMYTATLSLPTAATTGGCSAIITQWQTVTTNNTISIGGNRIKSITHNDGVTANDIITSYNYNDDNNNLSSGILYNRPVYVGISRNDFLRDYGGFLSTAGFESQWYAPNGCISAPDAGYFKSPTSIRPMASTQGNHIGYSQVKVSQSGNGYSKYKYFGSTGTPPWQQTTGDVVIRTINVQGCDNNAPSFPYAPVPFDYLRGELKEESQYNETGQKLRETNYTHSFSNSTIKTPALLVAYLSTSAQSGWTFATPYELATAKKTQIQVTETVYNPAEGTSQSNITTTYFESPFHNQPTKTLNTNSKGETVESRQKYVNDFRIDACDNIADGYTQYTTDCNACLATYNSKIVTVNPPNGIACNGDITCLTTAFLTYEKCKSDARINYVNYRRTNFTDPVNTFQTNHNAARDAANTDLKPILQLQDDYQNSVIEATKWKNGNLLGSSYSVFDYATTPAKVYLSKVQAVNVAAPSATFTNAATNTANTGVTKDSRYADETTAKFYDGNLAEITGKDGVTTAYLWGYNKTLPIAKSIGVPHTTLLNAYNAVGGNLVSLRTHSSLATAQLNTYEYNPAIGMVKETDVNGKHITYEYDKLQRLLLARDFNNNIVKQYDYKYQALPVNEGPQWVATSNTRCKPCPQNNAYLSNILQQEEKDNNPNSATYNNIRWTDIGTSTACVSNADWQNTSAPLQCKKNLFNQNTGWQTQEQMDMNPCSSTYGQTQWITTVYNPTVCPPPVCNTGNCSGNDKKCINNVCETGEKIYTSSVYNRLSGLWTCTYHYHWSDGSNSPDYTETSSVTCL